jgi:hypothetical protein
MVKFQFTKGQRVKFKETGEVGTPGCQGCGRESMPGDPRLEPPDMWNADLLAVNGKVLLLPGHLLKRVEQQLSVVLGSLAHQSAELF